jgi:hypothetical protein
VDAADGYFSKEDLDYYEQRFKVHEFELKRSESIMFQPKKIR